jgi:uncharacterized repeat protein (TIGR01451 family)
MILRVVVAALIFLLAAGSSVFADTVNWVAPQTNLLTTSDVRAAAPPTVTVTTTGARTGTFTSDPANNQLAITTGSNNGFVGTIASIMDAESTSTANANIVTFTFSEPVFDLTFTIIDIDGGPNFVDVAPNAGNNWNDWIRVTSNAGPPTSTSVVSPTSVVWNAAQSRFEAISDVNYGATFNPTFGNGTVTFAGPVTSVTVTHMPGIHNTSTNPTNQRIFIDDLTFKPRPRLAVSKSYSGGTGNNTFNFNISNSGAGVTPISVVTPGTAVTSAFTPLNATNTATTITETTTVGWIISPATSSCTDSNSAVSGNPSTAFAASVSGYVVTVPATNIRLGAIITCTIANLRVPTVAIGNPVNGSETGPTNGSMRVTLSAANAAATTVTYTVSGTATSGLDFTALSGTVTIPAGATQVTIPIPVINDTLFEGTETVVLTLTGVTSSNATLSTTITSSINIADNDVAAPNWTIAKTASTPGPVPVGTVITYTYTVRNTGNVAINNVSVSDVHNGFGTLPTPSGAFISTDAAPLNDSVAGTPTVWGSLAVGDSVRFTANYTVVQSDIDFRQ